MWKEREKRKGEGKEGEKKYEKSRGDRIKEEKEEEEDNGGWSLKGVFVMSRHIKKK